MLKRKAALRPIRKIKKKDIKAAVHLVVKDIGEHLNLKVNQINAKRL